MKKSAREIPLLRRTKLSKKAQERQDEIQKNYMKLLSGGNDWKFQLQWQKLECVDPKSNPKRVKPFSVSSKFY